VLRRGQGGFLRTQEIIYFGFVFLALGGFQECKCRIVFNLDGLRRGDKWEVVIDELHNQIEQIKQRLHPKRAHSHEDGDAHEMTPEVDSWDLRVHRQQATNVQKRRNTQVGSRSCCRA